MSDEARELLVYGMAAAQANSREEARNYLEWVLRTDADFDQQADAWYWLSRITDDPKERRDCLENVLAINPHYPEALRDIAIMEGRLNPADMPDPRFNVAPLTPHDDLSQDEAQDYKCPRCGARLTATGPNGSLACGFCGYRPGVDQPMSAPNTTPGVGEQDWIAAIYAIKGHRWELPTERAFKCNNCGANVILPAGHSSANCPFCGSPYVAQTTEERELIEPNGVAPFAFGAGEAFAHIVRWLHEQKFAPGNLNLHAMQSPPRPIYIPFWTFDVEGEVKWRGWQVSTELGKLVRAPAKGSVPLFYENVSIPASESLPAHLLTQMQYDLKHLTPYSPDLLASWPAEMYSLSVVEASLRAREYVHNSPRTQALVSSEASAADDVHDLQIEKTDLSVLSYKLVMLPVWVGSYIYASKSYDVLVNGQTSAVVGDVPRNAAQRLLDGLFG